jgi:hypothetical protein
MTGCLGAEAMTRQNHWFFDVPLPHSERDPVFLLDGFETYSEVRERSAMLRSVLWRGNRVERQKSLKLHRCRKNRRCGSAACPICIRRFRRWFVSQVFNLFGV